jgi:soluble lytic murein transglycosylase-like protein
MTYQLTGAIKVFSYLLAFVIGVTLWVYAAKKTIVVYENVVAYKEAKYLQARSWILDKLEAPTDIVISQPESKATLDHIIDAQSAAQSVSSDLVRALIAVESDFRQDAIAFNPEGDSKYGRMRSAAHSYMQVRGVHAGGTLCPDLKSWSELYDAKTNISCGIAIMKAALAAQPTLKLAMAEYNGGAQCIKGGKIVCAESEQHSAKVLEQLAEVIYKKSN